MRTRRRPEPRRRWFSSSGCASRRCCWRSRGLRNSAPCGPWRISAEAGLRGGRTVAVQLARAVLEGLNHAPHGLVEEHADEPLQHRRAELEIDIEVDAAAAVRQRLEDPVVAEIAERPLC